MITFINMTVKHNDLLNLITGCLYVSFFWLHVSVILMTIIRSIRDFFFRNQQSEYLGTLWADVLALSRGEVPSSEEISVVDSINCWLMYGSS